MKNMMKKVSAVLAAMVLALGLVAGANAEAPVEDILEVLDMTDMSISVDTLATFPEETISIASEEQTIAVEETIVADEQQVEVQPSSYTVVFYDFTGMIMHEATVLEGETVTALEETPVMTGLSFAHWYSDADESKAAFDFAAPVYENIALLPFGTEADINSSSILDIIAVETTIDEIETEEITAEDLAAQILGNTADETVSEESNPFPVVETVMDNDSADALINDILGLGNIEFEVIEEVEAVEETEVREVKEASFEELAAALLSTETVTIEDEATPLAGPVAPVVAPSVEVICDHDGKLVAGQEVTVRAVVHNLPEGYSISFQWQNDASGSFQDVAGANDETFTFVVDEFNADGCNWRVNVDIFA